MLSPLTARSGLVPSILILVAAVAPSTSLSTTSVPPVLRALASSTATHSSSASTPYSIPPTPESALPQLHTRMLPLTSSSANFRSPDMLLAQFTTGSFLTFDHSSLPRSLLASCSYPKPESLNIDIWATVIDLGYRFRYPGYLDLIPAVHR